MGDRTSDNETSDRILVSRRGVLGAGVVVAASQSGTTSAATLVGSSSVKRVNVRDHGAQADGVTDDTDAFNRATRASESWSEELGYAIDVPPGRYRIDGTVYVRKGQALAGAGVPTVLDLRAATRASFVLGRRQTASGTADPGGAPVSITGVRTIGGSPRAPVITTDAQGFSINDIFMSGPGIGIEATGADGRISNVIIDQGLNGIVLRDCQNIVISTVELYIVNYGLTIDRKSYDVIVANSLFFYSPYAAILFADGASNISNINVTASVFAMNEQYTSFSGFIHNRASHVDARFTACSFRNWSHVAVNHSAGNQVRLGFDGCGFDALQSNPDYNGSSGSTVLSTGTSGEYEFRNCSFRNLNAFANVSGGPARIVLDGGDMHSSTAAKLVVAANQEPDIAIRRVDGVVTAVAEGGRAIIVAPWWTPLTSWIIEASGVMRTREGAGHPFAVTFTILVSRDRAGGAVCILNTRWAVAPNAPPNVAIGFGDHPGGGATAGRSSTSGTLCVSWDDPESTVERFRAIATTIG
ncbi:MAG: glycosyl hydrolase family 28-related protein [Sphingomonas sp.]